MLNDAIPPSDAAANHDGALHAGHTSDDDASAFGYEAALPYLLPWAIGASGADPEPHWLPR